MISADSAFPKRLWSLWELMADPRFGDLVAKISGLSGFMHRFCVDPREERFPITLQDHDILIESIGLICAGLEALNLQMSLVTALEIKKIICEEIERPHALLRNNPGVAILSSFTRDRIRAYVEDLTGRYQDELNLQIVVFLDNKNSRFYHQHEPLFGKRVEKVFPLAAEDISEAGKCFAMSRDTATVFHLMRAMEAALLVLGNKLGVTIINKHDENVPWGTVVENMSKPIEDMPRGPEKVKWSQARTLLEHVGRSWRNDTMHPKKTYKPDEVDVIIKAVESFMKSLAELV